MSRTLLFAPLLLAAGVVLAAEVPEAKPVVGAIEAPARDEVPEARPVVGAIEAQARDEVPEAKHAAGPDDARAQDDLAETEQAVGATATNAQDGVSGAEQDTGAAETQAKTQEGPKVVSGMSVLGNQEAPKSLVIVPWKSSELGDSLGISPMLGDSRQPVDREVFMRALNYYEIRSETRP